MKDYSKAFAEVYEILNHLEEDEYKKIPTSFLDTIKNNRDFDYNYIIYEDIELKEHEMLPETKAILFNIFRDYLSTPEQKQKILRMQAEERKQNEERKRKEYYANKPLVEESKVELITVEHTETIWQKAKNILTNFLKLVIER